MRCPECNTKWKWKRDLEKNKCHKCGKEMNIRDFLSDDFIEELKRSK